jgi:hypothetical protein
LIIVISFSCIAPFISMKCPSLSPLANGGLKSTLIQVVVLLPILGSFWPGNSSFSLSP